MLEELRRQRHECAREMRSLLNKAEADNRDLNDDERTSWDERDRRIRDLDARIGRAERAAELGDDAERRDAEFEGMTDEQREAAARADSERLEAHRLANGGSTEERVAQTLNEFRAITYGAVPQDDESFRAQFFRYLTLRGAINERMTTDEFRVLSQATNPGGGYLVPQTFERTLLTRARDFGIMRELATVITTQTGEKIAQPQENAHGTAAWLAINAAYPESDESFAQITLDAFKAGTMIRVAEELLQDAAFDLEGYIARQFAIRIGILENTAYVVGDGVGKPTGIVTSAPVGYTLPVGNVAQFPNADPFVRLYHSVLMAYRNRGAWLMRDSSLMAVRLLKDGQGNYLWRPGLTEGAPDVLLGRPVHTDPDMPAMAANAKSVLFGDFSNYVIRDVQGVGIQRLNELFAANGQVGFRAYHRTEGKLVNTDAVAALAQSAT